MPSDSAISSPEAFFLNAAPYQKFELNSDNFGDAVCIQFFQGTLDAYCVTCQNDSVFQSQARPLSSNPSDRLVPVNTVIASHAHVSWPGSAGVVYASELENHVRTDRSFESRFTCSRVNDHFMIFLVHVTRDSISKAGQIPSLADLQTYRIKKYRKLLGDQKWIEFSKAFGLQAHGVGIGGFVYLRRVFEHVIERAHAEASKEPGWQHEQYEKSMRMEDKIQLLKAHLPEFLVRNRRIYPILGKGIHELSDDECLAAFDPIRVGIELILDEEIERTEKARKIKQAQTALDSLNP